MTTTPPDAPSGAEAPQDHGPRVTRDEVRDLGRLRRSITDRKVAGVAGGLARHLDVDPVILRVALVVLVFFGGAGLIIYGACWLLVPEEGSTSAPLHLDDRTRAVALIIAGIVAAAALVGDSWGASWFPWPLAVVALVVLVLLTRKDGGRAPAPPQPPVYGPPTADAAGPAYDPTGTAAYAAPPVASSPGYAPYYPPNHPQPGWVPPAPVRPRSPRKRGPILFWFTLALIVLAEGVLGTVDLAGVDVAGSAYPALAVGISGVMLLVGAFWGRAGGVILLGLVSSVFLAGATVADNWDGERLERTPARAADVDPAYSIRTGELVLDLRQVENLSALDGRTVRVSGDVGRLEVILPDGLDADVHADVNGPGNVNLFGEETGGIDLTMDRQHDGGAVAPEITIDAELEIGQIEVHQR
ncbi:PspC domain-containing protein [Nocardioides sp. MAHUQ-72]|uniref:PspC domain-containing protein n=1 Tax=unclassified Nocardioides TaxID=2615069 RepID=UPI00360EE715